MVKKLLRSFDVVPLLEQLCGGIEIIQLLLRKNQGLISHKRETVNTANRHSSCAASPIGPSEYRRISSQGNLKHQTEGGNQQPVQLKEASHTS
eukprot:2559457-Pleurochrysis_carterae.AAC.1